MCPLDGRTGFHFALLNPLGYLIEVSYSLGWEDPLEEDMATHSSILVWRIKEPGGLLSMGSQRVGHD